MLGVTQSVSMQGKSPEEKDCFLKNSGMCGFLGKRCAYIATFLPFGLKPFLKGRAWVCNQKGRVLFMAFISCSDSRAGIRECKPHGYP